MVLGGGQAGEIARNQQQMAKAALLEDLGLGDGLVEAQVAPGDRLRITEPAVDAIIDALAGQIDRGIEQNSPPRLRIEFYSRRSEMKGRQLGGPTAKIIQGDILAETFDGLLISGRSGCPPDIAARGQRGARRGRPARALAARSKASTRERFRCRAAQGAVSCELLLHTGRGADIAEAPAYPPIRAAHELWPAGRRPRFPAPAPVGPHGAQRGSRLFAPSGLRSPGKVPTRRSSTIIQGG